MLPNNSNQHTAFRLLFDSSPTATALSRLSDGKYVEVNEAFLRLHGYAREEVIGYSNEELKLGHNLEARKIVLANLKKVGEINNVSVEWHHQSGKTGIAMLSARIIKVDGESFIAEFLTDALLLEVRQHYLVEADHFLATIFNELPSGIAVCRMRYLEGVPIDFIYLRINPAFERLTGLLNAAGHWVSELIPGIRESNPKLFEIYGRVASGNEPEIFEVYVEQLNIWFEISAFSYQPEHFVAVFNVITNHKRLEQELRNSAERLHLVINASKLATWDSDRTSGRVVFDRRWCEIIGSSQEELVQTTEGWMEFIHPEDKARVIAAIKEHELGNTPMYKCEYRIRHKDGHWVWVSSRGQIVARDNQGNALRLLGTVRDISAPKSIANEGAEFLRRIETMVQELVSAKEDTLGPIAPSHPAPELLSRRQREVLILIAQGMTSAEIAKKLKVGTATVISHRRSLMKVLGLHSAADLTRFAIKHALVS